MSEDCVGCRASVDCGSLGVFQGVISKVCFSDQSVTLEKPYLNGLACKFPEITLKSSDIDELKILKSREDLQSEAAAAPAFGSSVVQVIVRSGHLGTNINSSLLARQGSCEEELEEESEHSGAAATSCRQVWRQKDPVLYGQQPRQPQASGEAQHGF